MFAFKSAGEISPLLGLDYSGASVLPFGFMMDVSAGALAAGAGALKGGAGTAQGASDAADGSAGAFEGLLNSSVQLGVDGEAASAGEGGTQDAGAQGAVEQAMMQALTGDVPVSALPSEVLTASLDGQVLLPDDGGQSSADDALDALSAPDAPDAPDALDAAGGAKLPVEGGGELRGQGGEAISGSSSSRSPDALADALSGQADGANGDEAAEVAGASEPEGLDDLVEQAVSQKTSVAAVQENASSRAESSEVPVAARKWQVELPEGLRAAETAPVNTAQSSKVLSSSAQAETLDAVPAAGQSVPQEVTETQDGVALVPEGAVEAGVDSPGETEAVADEAVRAGQNAQLDSDALEPAAEALNAGKAVVEPSKAQEAAKDVSVSAAPSVMKSQADRVAQETGTDALADEAALAEAAEDAEADGPALQKEARTGKPDGAVKEGGSDTKPSPATNATAAVATNSDVVTDSLEFAEEQKTADFKLNARDLTLGSELSASLRGGDMHGAARTEALQSPNQTQSSQIASQVAVEMARNLKNAQTKFQMRFDPPELGRVDVNMKVSSDGSVQAHLIVERPETLDMFLRDQRGLERALEAAGLSVDANNLQFSLKQDGGQEFSSGSDDSSQSGAGVGETSDTEDGSDDYVPIDIARMNLAEQRGGLDLKV